MIGSVLHLDTESTWRGGENQLKLLVEHAPKGTCRWHLAAPPGSEVIKRLAPFAETIAVPMRGLSLLSAARALATYVRHHNIDLIDCQSSRAHNLGLLIKFLVPECRLVVHRRVDYPPGAGWLHRRKYLSKKVDTFICISEAIAQVLSDFGVPRDRLQVVRSAVDAGPFRNLDRPKFGRYWREQWGLSPETLIVGNVAYLTEQKDQATLIAALGLLKAQGSNFFCYIAGDGPLAAPLRRQAEGLGLDQRWLRFLGVRQDIPELLAGTDIFALSSQDEGLGTSLLDATHSGCTLVATAAGGIPEIVKDAQTGLLAPVGDASIFAAKLGLALQNAELRQALVAAARALAEEKFSLQAMVNGNLEVYRRLLAQV